jgi:proline dehydrogenase
LQTLQDRQTVLKLEIEHTHYDKERAIELVNSTQQQLDATNSQLSQAQRLIIELENEMAQLKQMNDSTKAQMQSIIDANSASRFQPVLDALAQRLESEHQRTEDLENYAKSLSEDISKLSELRAHVQSQKNQWQSRRHLRVDKLEIKALQQEL